MNSEKRFTSIRRIPYGNGRNTSYYLVGGSILLPRGGEPKAGILLKAGSLRYSRIQADIANVCVSRQRPNTFQHESVWRKHRRRAVELWDANVFICLFHKKISRYVNINYFILFKVKLLLLLVSYSVLKHCRIFIVWATFLIKILRLFYKTWKTIFWAKWVWVKRVTALPLPALPKTFFVSWKYITY